MSQLFTDPSTSREGMWRSVILLGRNVASYKFALGKSLLELADRDQEVASLEELAAPFSRHLREHLTNVNKQGISPQSQFLDACRSANRGELSEEELIEATARLGFVNVIDAFHVVGQGEIPVRFFEDERRTKARGIRLTDEIRALRQGTQASNLLAEVEARWRLVETAWELDLPRSVIEVTHDPDGDLLVVEGGQVRRRSVTGCREALNGYQRGGCFYCRRESHLEEFDIDHFFPHRLKYEGSIPSLDGVWNLVLACRSCNRGAKGKFDAVPEKMFLIDLYRRNEYLIASHHPLRETLRAQTGQTYEQRHDFLQAAWDVSYALGHWRPEEVLGLE